MNIVPLSPEELREALDGAVPGGAAESWRLLREDVRALAPPLDPEFERQLRERLAERDRAPRAAGEKSPARLARLRRSLIGLRDRTAPKQLFAGLAAAVCVLAIVLTAAGSFSGPGTRGVHRGAPRASAEYSSTAPAVAQAESAGQSSDSVHAPEQGTLAPAQPAASDGARVQQQGASITLAPAASEVQTVADGVSRLASREGGFVANSQVNVQREGAGASEATLTLEVPSGRLSATLAALGRLAPVRAQSQSLQDITNSYEQARRAVSDAVAERAALLRALGRATTQGQIESLHRRLSLAGTAIERTQAALRAVTHRASNSRLEVAVLANAHKAASGLTLSRGLHDVGRVLTVALIALLIGLAVIVPLGLLVLVLVFGVRLWRRSQRERALDGA